MKEFLNISSMNKQELTELISHTGDDTELYNEADKIRRMHYGNKVYIRGLIEISNYCKNNCLYCGIRERNLSLSRYRLTKEDILSCARVGYELGFRTFVMQGGEDEFFTDDFMCSIISACVFKFNRKKGCFT